ncbi:MaoC family dehydratase [Gordonia sp. TBRC 11910]|uniref:MaoC family dehydratase n=1 Tax=Gordonia asplenii TaxID=2725283 RepID=A0A848L5N9_9ACTN|nr:MaoC family dehydratase [Gordonia asplenii]NMO02928.1 MaoC family dehydratase [Gordonia asplenii]
MREFATIDELASYEGHLGYSEWHTIDQERVDGFGRITADEQWIHVDPVRAADGPFGTTIAHGYLTLSMIPAMTREIYSLNGVRMGVNYGLNKVRFVAPVVVGSRIRAGAEVQEVTEVSENCTQITLLVRIECDGVAKPACIA